MTSPAQIPFVDYLILGDTPHLQVNECTNCGARFFDRRNACASCFGTDFTKARVSTTGVITSYSIPHTAKQPFVSAIVDCDGTPVRATIINVDPSPDQVEMGMAVKLATYSMGTDADGTEAIAFGFAPA